MAVLTLKDGQVGEKKVEYHSQSSVDSLDDEENVEIYYHF